VRFLNERGGGVMDLIAHFWERLGQTPPLQRGDLHLILAGDPFVPNVPPTPPTGTGRNGKARAARRAHESDEPRSDIAGLMGAMLYVPKAHRADVLALDAAAASAFVNYIRAVGALPAEGGPAVREEPVAAGPGPASTAGPTDGTIQPATTGTLGAAFAGGTLHRIIVTVASDNKHVQSHGNGKIGSERPAAGEVNGGDTVASAAGTGPVGTTAGSGIAGGPAAGGGGGGIAIDFLTGGQDGIQAMVPLLLPLVHKRSPARQLVNVVMQLPADAPTYPDPLVRVVRDADAPVLSRWRKLYREERGILFDADIDAWVQSKKIYVCEDQGQIVSLAKFDLELPRLIEIGGVYTFPEFRGCGYGARIVRDLAARIRTLGKIPTLQVDRENTTALRLYQRQGWKQMGMLARIWLTG
jgi:GNAT superfamily N-acetyltransferase